jgi:hypothetical protein
MEAQAQNDETSEEKRAAIENAKEQDTKDKLNKHAAHAPHIHSAAV